MATRLGVRAPYRGQSPPRPHARELVQGLGRFVADATPPGCLEACFVRSYLAHGEVLEVAAGPARTLPGVVAAYAAADLPELPDVPAAANTGQPAGMRRPALARDRVRFVGEPVAVVLAEDRYLAEDAAELVEVDLAPLPVVLDPAEAARPGAPQLFPGLPNVSSERRYGEPVADVLATAPVVVTTTVLNQRVSPMSIEPRAILVVPDSGGGFHVWCSHQAPHRLRRALATAFGLPAEAIRVTAPDVGGAFGAKSQTYAEYLVVFELARRHGRPVRWLEDRAEALVAAIHGRGQHTSIRLVADRGGRLLALDAAIDADVGAYPDFGDFIPALTAWVMSGPYRIPRLQVRTRSVLTNAAPTASYRGAGRPEAAYALERAMDELARASDLDPAELRRRNFIPPEAFPYRSPTGAVYDSGRYADALAQAVELADYAGWRAEQGRRRAAGEAPLLGIGIASWVERSGGEGGSPEYARVEVRPGGTVVGRVGTSPQGQAHELTFAQVLADALGVALDRVELRLGDTAEVAQGTGAFGSRSMQVGGSALHRAARAVLAEARERAGVLLGEPPEQLDYADGVFRGSSGVQTDLGALATAAPLSAEDVFTPPQAFPFGSYVAVVEVDPRTGRVSIVRLAAVDDCGVVVNPAVVEGQILGSIAQGIGQALYEQVRYDEEGQITTSTLLDYTVPTAAEMPPLRLGSSVTPNPNVPLGAKGAGESGCIGAPPAIANAVHDALRDYDRTGLEMPLTPDKVWACLQRPAALRGA